MFTSNRNLGTKTSPQLELALRRAALRQTATLRAASAAVTYAPTLDDCAAAIDRMREEFEHLERSVELYRDLFGSDLTDRIAPEVAHLPAPASWLEASVGQLVLCTAGRIEGMCSRHESSPLEAAFAHQAAEESEHVDAARASLREFFATRSSGAPEAPCYLVRWLQVARDTLDEAVQPLYLDTLRRDIETIGFPFSARSIIAA